MTAIADELSAGVLGIFGLPGHWEVIIIILVILLLFGGRKLPELARGLARGLRSFKEELKGTKTAIEDIDKDVKEVGKDVKELKDSQPPDEQPDQHDQA